MKKCKSLMRERLEVPKANLIGQSSVNVVWQYNIKMLCAVFLKLDWFIEFMLPHPLPLLENGKNYR